MLPVIRVSHVYLRAFAIEDATLLEYKHEWWVRHWWFSNCITKHLIYVFINYPWHWTLYDIEELSTCYIFLKQLYISQLFALQKVASIGFGAECFFLGIYWLNGPQWHFRLGLTLLLWLLNFFQNFCPLGHMHPLEVMFPSIPRHIGCFPSRIKCNSFRLYIQLLYLFLRKASIPEVRGLANSYFHSC